MIAAELDLIQELQTDKYWQDITAPMLEIVRKRLRNLIKLIEKTKRKIVYTDFLDEIGAPTGIDLPGISVGMGFERFKKAAISSKRMKITLLLINCGATSR
jgi:type I restriction enzyme, R subunit